MPQPQIRTRVLVLKLKNSSSRHCTVIYRPFWEPLPAYSVFREVLQDCNSPVTGGGTRRTRAAWRSPSKSPCLGRGPMQALRRSLNQVHGHPGWTTTLFGRSGTSVNPRTGLVKTASPPSHAFLLSYRSRDRRVPTAGQVLPVRGASAERAAVQLSAAQAHPGVRAVLRLHGGGSDWRLDCTQVCVDQTCMLA